MAASYASKCSSAACSISSDGSPPPCNKFFTVLTSENDNSVQYLYVPLQSLLGFVGAAWWKKLCRPGRAELLQKLTSFFQLIWLTFHDLLTHVKKDLDEVSWMKSYLYSCCRCCCSLLKKTFLWSCSGQYSIQIFFTILSSLKVSRIYQRRGIQPNTEHYLLS